MPLPVGNFPASNEVPTESSFAAPTNNTENNERVISAEPTSIPASARQGELSGAARIQAIRQRFAQAQARMALQSFEAVQDVDPTVRRAADDLLEGPAISADPEQGPLEARQRVARIRIPTPNFLAELGEELRQRARNYDELPMDYLGVALLGRRSQVEQDSPLEPGTLLDRYWSASATSALRDRFVQEAMDGNMHADLDALDVSLNAPLVAGTLLDRIDGARTSHQRMRLLDEAQRNNFQDDLRQYSDLSSAM